MRFKRPVRIQERSLTISDETEAPLFERQRNAEQAVQDKRAYWMVGLKTFGFVAIIDILITMARPPAAVAPTLLFLLALGYYALNAIRICVPYRVRLFCDRICVEDKHFNGCLLLEDVSTLYFVVLNKGRGGVIEAIFGVWTVDGRKIPIHTKYTDGFLQSLRGVNPREVASDWRYEDKVLTLTYEGDKQVKVPVGELALFGEGSRVLAESAPSTIYVRTTKGVTYWIGPTTQVMPTTKQMVADFPLLWCVRPPLNTVTPSEIKMPS